MFGVLPEDVEVGEESLMHEPEREEPDAGQLDDDATPVGDPCWVKNWYKTGACPIKLYGSVITNVFQLASVLIE